MSRTNTTIQRKERRKRVFQLVLAGLTFQEAGDRIGVSIATVSRDVHFMLGELEKTTLQDTAQYRKLEMRRLDLLHSMAWQEASQGDMAALDRVLKIQDQRAKYMPQLQAPDEIRLALRDLTTEQLRELHSRLVDDQSRSSTAGD